MVGGINPNGDQFSVGAESMSCRPLLDLATIGIYRANAFRLTGLAVECSTREIAKHADKLRLMAEIGQVGNWNEAAFALSPPPGLDELRNAIHRLKDPERRLLDELFWFWPQSSDGSRQDASLQALSKGDHKKALQFWEQSELDPATSLVARHNLAVYCHMMALDGEFPSHDAPPSLNPEVALVTYWRGALTRFDSLAEDDLFWAHIAMRAKQIDELRLTGGFVERLRASFPIAVGTLNASLAIHYSEKGRQEVALYHLRLLREFKFLRVVHDPVASIALAPAEQRVRTHLKLAVERGAANPETGASAAHELVGISKQLPALFGLFHKSSNRLDDICNEVATVSANLGVAQYKSTGGDQMLRDVFQAALPFATSREIRDRLERDIAALDLNLRQRELEPIYQQLKQLQESAEKPENLLELFKYKVRPLAENALSRLTRGSKPHTDLSNSLAIVLRDISMKAWNVKRDFHTARDACELALGYVVAAEIRRQLLQDKTLLKGVEAAKKSKETSIFVKILALIALVGLAKCLPDTRRSSRSSYTLPEQQQYTTSSDTRPHPRAQRLKKATNLNQFQGLDLPAVRATSGSTAPASLPVEASKAESGTQPGPPGLDLNSERTSLEAERARLADVESYMKELGQKIDLERSTLNPTDAHSVDHFNGEIRLYNLMAEQFRSDFALLNARIKQYNSKLTGNRQ